ncbi:MAG: DNA polymerase IV, partial [Myxococcota bacterium]
MGSILHVDMDAFFASVEQHDDPALRGKPVLVGMRSVRGVVAAASYEARPSGVRSAMPMVEALRRLPDAIVVPPRMDRYVEVSAAIFAIFRRFTPLVEGLSVDEAFLDVSGTERLFGDAVAVARQIKETIRAETGLTASAGVAPSKFVAKVASALDKPDGLVVVAPEAVREFLAPLPIEKMWGVGPKAAARLRAHGLATLGDLAARPEAELEALLGSWGASVGRLARGDDERPVVPDRDAKSVGAEETFERDRRSVAELEPALLHQAGRVAARLTRAGLRGGTVTVKLKYAGHVLKTRQRKMDPPVNDTDSIYEAARGLLGRFPDLRRGVRLSGVSVGDLMEGEPGRSLFEDGTRDRRERIEALTGELRARFGSASLQR